MANKNSPTLYKPQKGLIPAIKSYFFGDDSGVTLDLSQPTQTFMQMLSGSYSFNNYGLHRVVDLGYKSNPLGYSAITKILLAQQNIKFEAYWKGELYKSKKVEIDIKKATFNLITTGTAVIWKRKVIGFPDLHEVIDTLKVEELIDSSKKTYYYQEHINIRHTIKEDELIFIRYAEIPYYFGNMGLSPFQAGALAIDSIIKSYEYNVNLVHNKGVDGMITNDSNENVETMDAKEFDKQLNERLSGSKNAGKIATSTFKLRYFNIGRPPKELMLWDGYKYAFRDLCNVLQVDSGLFNDEELNTYANRNEAIKGLYNECVIPITKLICENKSLVNSLGYEIFVDTKDIEALQESQSIKAEKAKTNTDAIINLNNNVNSGTISREIAVIILSTEWGFSEEEANMVIIDKFQQSISTSDKVNVLSPIVATKVMESMTTNERRELIGLDTIVGGDTVPQNQPSF